MALEQTILALAKRAADEASLGIIPPGRLAQPQICEEDIRLIDVERAIEKHRNGCVRLPLEQTGLIKEKPIMKQERMINLFGEA